MRTVVVAVLMFISSASLAQINTSLDRPGFSSLTGIAQAWDSIWVGGSGAKDVSVTHLGAADTLFVATENDTTSGFVKLVPGATFRFELTPAQWIRTKAQANIIKRNLVATFRHPQGR